MTLPDWLVERAALDEVPAASRARLASDPQELADRIADLRDENAAELAAYPADQALAQIEARVASEAKQRSTARRRRWIAMTGAMASTAAIVVVVMLMRTTPTVEAPPDAGDDDGIRIKGGTRVLVFRQVGPQAQQLAEDALVRAGDLLQLRYQAGGRTHGLIASIDGAGAVTLHFPASETAATSLETSTTSLPTAYALDDAPAFERFFFVTADAPIDVKRMMATLGAFARRDDSATASLDLPTGLGQWSLRLRKPDRHRGTP